MKKYETTDIKRLQKALSNDYIPEIVDNVEEVVDLLDRKQEKFGTLVRDVVMSTEDVHLQQIIYQTVFALMNINFLEVDFIDLETEEIIDHNLVQQVMILGYEGKEPKEIEYEGRMVQVKNIEMIVYLKQ